jgi:septin family protein
MTGVVEGETGDKIFVYGEEVDDFVHIVELETQIQTEKERTQQIEADLQTTRTELEQALEAEKVKTKNLESRLAFLETAVASLIS